MAYIEPKGKVWLCKNVPLNPSYEDTMTWNSIEEQINYFIGKTKWSSEKYTPIKERQGVLRFNGAVNKFYDCNYMMFENDNFYNTEYNWGEEKYNLLAPKKYFFAFITNVEYVNPETTLIHFQLDVMQTWFFEIEWERSLIEREHVKDDSLYANLEPENIQVNERIPYSKNFNISDKFGDRILVTGFTENPYNIQKEGGGGIFGNKRIPYTPFVNYPEIEKSSQPRVVQNYSVYNIGLQSGAPLSNASYNQVNNEFYVDSTVTSFTFYLRYDLYIDNINTKDTIETHIYYITAGVNTETSEWFFTGYEIPGKEYEDKTVLYSLTSNYPNIEGASILLDWSVSDFKSPNLFTGFQWKPYVYSTILGDQEAKLEIEIYLPETFTDTEFTFTVTVDDWYKKEKDYYVKAEYINNEWVFSKNTDITPEGE